MQNPEFKSERTSWLGTGCFSKRFSCNTISRHFVRFGWIGHGFERQMASSSPPWTKRGLTFRVPILEIVAADVNRLKLLPPE
jgi:hypothetical protein